ncbi:O-antigen polymerase [Anatilimnocola sp. NA78]|uniref:O-antigen polymerase n=1 Tax=Anatilimnocola sp. NA78 TaxID=3415683 RepID=UPI003CE53E4E
MSTAVPHRTPLGRLWWLNPSWVFGMGTIGTFALAQILSDKAYSLYETPKYLKTEHWWIALSAWLALEIGRRIGSQWQKKPGQSGDAIAKDVEWWFLATFYMTVGAYSLLLLRGLQNGLSLGVILENLLAPPQDVSRELAGEVVVFIPGVTTATQFGIICVLLGLWLNHRGVAYVRKYMAVIVGLSAMRALLFHERLAMIEVVVPAAVLVLRLYWLARPLSPALKNAFRVAPVVGLIGVVTMFGVFEYFRSWRHYRNEFTSYTDFTLWRIGGYYSTSQNNGALGWEREGQRPLPLATFDALWEFPPIEKSPLSYESLTGVNGPAAHTEMLKQYANVEYNSPGGLFEPIRDFGVIGSLIWWTVFGALLGWAYRGYLEGSLIGCLLFPIAFLSLLEMPRFVYLTHPRILAPLVVIVWLGCRLWLAERKRRTAEASVSYRAQGVSP